MNNGFTEAAAERDRGFTEACPVKNGRRSRCDTRPSGVKPEGAPRGSCCQIKGGSSPPDIPASHSRRAIRSEMNVGFTEAAAEREKGFTKAEAERDKGFAAAHVSGRAEIHSELVSELARLQKYMRRCWRRRWAPRPPCRGPPRRGSVRGRAARYFLATTVTMIGLAVALYMPLWTSIRNLPAPVTDGPPPAVVDQSADNQAETSP